MYLTLKQSFFLIPWLFSLTPFSQNKSIDDGIGVFHVDALSEEIWDFTYICQASAILDLNESIKFIDDFIDANCIDLKKSGLKTLFGLKTVQGQVFYKQMAPQMDLQVHTVKFYLTPPKNKSDKASFIRSVELEFGASLQWIDPASKEVLRMDWSTSKTFCCIELAYNMTNDTPRDYYIISFSQNYPQ